ncbi:MAG: SRPBCC family protein [Actinomycetota bacterium]|nr:SRPBCC family protein [Actinomycetota bacterium]
MPKVQVVAESTASPERVLEAARDFSERRAELWPDVHVEHLEVHDRGETWAEVTEGNPWPIGFVWERLRYDWSQPGLVNGTVVDSNIFKPGSTWGIRAEPATGGGSRVEITAVRHLRGLKGRILTPVFPLGLARRSVADHLRHFLSKVEEAEPTPES